MSIEKSPCLAIAIDFRARAMGEWKVVEDEKGENLSAIFYTQFSEMLIEMEIFRLKIP